MYPTLLALHSITRWFVLGSLLFSALRAYKGFFRQQAFQPLDETLRHWTATIAHLQLLIGITLYSQSPIARYFWAHTGEAIHQADLSFFGLYHMLLMTISVVLITIGSAMTKRKQAGKEQYRTIMTWFTLALLIILLAIPWPFSPIAHRPLFRPF